MEIRNQGIQNLDPTLLNQSTTVQRTEAVSTAFSKMMRKLSDPNAAQKEELLPSEAVEQVWSPQAIYQSMAMQVPSPTSTSRSVRGICWTDQTLAVFIGNGGQIPIDTGKTINWDSTGDQELSEQKILELRAKYDLDHLTAQDYYNLLSDLTHLGVLSAHDCASMHLSTASSGISFLPFPVDGQTGRFDGNLLSYLSRTLDQMLINWEWIHSPEYDQSNLFGSEAKEDYRASLQQDIQTRRNMIRVLSLLVDGDSAAGE